MDNFLQNEKKILNGIFILSAIVLVLVIILGMLPQAKEIPSYVKYLPKLNAILNGTCSVLLITSYYYIRKKNVTMHKKLNIITFVLSSIFLLSYVTLHSHGIETRF